MDHGNASSKADPLMLGTVSVPKSYQERIDLKLCTKCGREPCKPDSNLGERCHGKVKGYQAKSARKRRAAARKKKLCTRCTKRRRSPRSKWGCSVCLAELRRLQFPVVDPHVDPRASNTRDHVERDGYTRTRYTGQAKRGAPSTATLDLMDLRDALKDLAKAAEGYAYAQSDEVQQKPTIQRDSHTDDWVVVVSRVKRVLLGIEDRHPETMRRMNIEESRRRGAEIARIRKRPR